MKVLGCHIDPNGINNKNVLKYPYPSSIKIFKILNIYTTIILKKVDTSSILVTTTATAPTFKINHGKVQPLVYLCNKNMNAQSSENYKKP